MSDSRSLGTDSAISPAAEQPRAARILAWLIGFCLPLSGGLPLSRWIPGFIDQFTPIRLVTVAALAWIAVQAVRSRRTDLPGPSRAMIVALIAGMAYATLTLLWTPDRSHGIHDVITVGLAVATPIALILLVERDRKVLAGFASGVLITGASQVLLTVVELTTGFHASTQFGAPFLAERNLERIEEVFGPVAIGTMGNPNDLGGLLLLTLAVFLNSGAYGLEIPTWARRLGWVFVTVSVVVGVTFLNDARGFRLGVLLLAAMQLADRWLVRPRLVRIPALAVFTVVAFFLTLLPIREWISAVARLMTAGGSGAGTAAPPELPPIVGESDSLRLELLSRAFKLTVDSFGFGRGIGTERALLASGELRINFHNVVAQLAAEVGIVIAAAFLVYLLALLWRWAFVTRSAQRQPLSTRAKAGLALGLLLYGITSSGVLESPVLWGFFGATALLSGLNVSRGAAEAELEPGL